MSHEIQNINGTWSFAFSPVEGPGWHNLGRMVADSASAAEWRATAGHDFEVEKRQVMYADKNGVLVPCEDRFVMARADNDHALGIASDKYKIVQPLEVDDICDEFAAIADGALARSSAFTLRKGDMICSTYAYRAGALTSGEALTIGGDAHQAYLMASTTFDGTGATQFWISLIRAVCANTIRAGLASAKGAIVSVRHNATLKPEMVRQQLAELAQSVSQFKALGDKLAQHTMSPDQIGAFFRGVLEIPADATQDKATGEIIGTSTRKFNQFADLCRAFTKAKRERNGASDAFTALQAITDYADHTRAVKVNGTGNETIARFDSATFGSGDKFKASAMKLLKPLIEEKVAA